MYTVLTGIGGVCSVKVTEKVVQYYCELMRIEYALGLSRMQARARVESRGRPQKIRSPNSSRRYEPPSAPAPSGDDDDVDYDVGAAEPPSVLSGGDELPEYAGMNSSAVALQK